VRTVRLKLGLFLFLLYKLGLFTTGGLDHVHKTDPENVNKHVAYLHGVVPPIIPTTPQDRSRKCKQAFSH
jgi:hypothetical protein